MLQFDIIVIGAGAVGNAIAREVSKKNNAAVCVLEKEPDTAFGISGRNSGVLHAGFNNKPGSLMAKLCVRGCETFEEEANNLGISFKRTGKLIIAGYEEDIKRLNQLKDQGEANGVKGLKILSGEETETVLGYRSGVASLFSVMTGIFDPFQYTIALAEAAVSQGSKYYFGRQVTSITTKKNGEGFIVTAKNLLSRQEEHYHTRVLINSAGLYSDEISAMVGINDYKLFPCRGEYHILDKKQSSSLELPIYPVPNERDGGLGVHLTPTIHGNIMIGPSAEYLTTDREREDFSTTQEVMDRLRAEGADLFPGLSEMDCIRSFSGIRPKLASEAEGGYADFVIEASKQVHGFIQLIGIESPGLTASIPIARLVAGLVQEIMDRSSQGISPMPSQETLTMPSQETLTVPSHESPPNLAEEKIINPFRESDQSISNLLCDQGDEKMLCRCEGITERSILAAYDQILSIAAIPTVRGIKNRTRVTMGSCQGSFCTINIIELLQKKRQVDPLTFLWNGFGSHMFEGRVRE